MSKMNFKGSSSTQYANNAPTYSAEENKIIKRSALLGGAFYGCLSTGLVMLWEQFSKNKGTDIPTMKLKPKREAIITIAGGLFVATVGAIVSAMQAKQAINVMHNNMNKMQNNQDK